MKNNLRKMVNKRPTKRRLAFKKTALASMVSAITIVSSQTTFGQEEIREEVIVRGIRASLNQSLDIKRNSQQLVEVITADDIGKMPDQNIAESLQRLPGVQIDRRDGEGTKVRIRGLDQNITLLNGGFFTSGLEYFQLGEWKQEFDGSLEGVPSELLGGVEVYKSPVASMVEGGMGGVVNLKTRNAFDLKEPLVAANVKIDQGSYSEDAQPSGFVVFGNNWDDRFAVIGSLSLGAKTVHTDHIQNHSRSGTEIKTFFGNSSDASIVYHDPRNNGVALGDDVLLGPGEDDYIDLSMIPDNDENRGYIDQVTAMRAAATADANGNVALVERNYFAPGMYYVMDNEQERERIGSSLSFQFRASDALDFSLDWFHSDQTIDMRQYVVKHPVNADGATGIDFTQPFIVDNSLRYGVVEMATFNSPDVETNAAGEATDVSADNFRLAMNFDSGGKWRFKGDLTASTSDLEQRAGYADSRFSPYTMRSFTGDTLVIDTNDDDVPDAPSETGYAGQVVNPGPEGAGRERNWTFVQSNQPSIAFTNSDWLSNPLYHTYKSHWALGSDVEQDTFAVRGDAEYDIEVGDLKRIKFGLRVAEKEADFRELRYLTDFSQTAGAMSPNLFDADGNIRQATDFDRLEAPEAGELNVGVREAVYYDLCGNGGLPAGEICDIDGDGEDDNRGAGPLGYFLDAAIGLKAFDLVTSDGTNMAVALYGPEMANSTRWDYSPNYLPWETFSDNPSRYINISDFFPSGGYQGDVLFQNADHIVSDVEGWIAGIAPNSPGRFYEVPLESWNVKESTTALYFEADFEGDDIPYTLNVGVRLVNTEVDVTVAETNEDSSRWSLSTDDWNSQGVLLVFDTNTTTKDYWDILPSLNFVLDTSDVTKVRFSAARVIARPSLQDLGRGFQKGYTRVNEPYTYFQFTGGSGGNPNLDPYRATQADFNFEYYMGDLSYFSAGVFVKAVDSFIARQTREVFGRDDGPGGGRLQGVDLPFNGAGGSVKGIELAYQKYFDNGYGISTNYTYSANKADVNTTTNTDVGLPGVSENAFNLVGFFENDVISARLSYTWRDAFLSPDRAIYNVDGLPEGASEFFDSYGQWDANITWHAFEGFDASLEIINLSEEDQTSYLAYPNNPMTYTAQERRIILGASYSF